MYGHGCNKFGKGVVICERYETMNGRYFASFIVKILTPYFRSLTKQQSSSGRYGSLLTQNF